jgi:hypothetical protein
MKSRSFRFLISALAIAGFFFAACNKDELKPGINNNLPGTEGLAYDETNSGPKVIALQWNADDAIKAGAKSFTIQLTQSLKNGGDIYGSTSKTFSISTDPSKINNAISFSGLTTDDRYYARGRANYENGKMSDWIYVSKPDSVGVPAVIKVGSGIYDGPISDISQPEIKLLRATSSTLSFQFTSTKFTSLATDIARTYNAKLYKDEACTNLLVSWSLNVSQTAWTVAYGGPRFIFSGLTPNTKYYIKIVDETDTESKLTSDVLSASTTDYTVKTVPSTANAGDIILSEDFSEFVWGGALTNDENAAGYTADKRGTSTALTPATGENPIGDAVFGYSICKVGQNMGLFNTLGPAIPSTRLKDWGYHNEIKTAGNAASGIGALCAMPGCLQIGASSLNAQIVTPELNCLSGVATLSVSYDVQAESTDPNRHFYVDIITKSTDDSYCVTYNDVDCINVSDSVYTNNTTMTTKTIDIPNVPVGARLAFGGKRVPGTSGQQRFFFDNLIVKVKSYGSTHINIATPVVTLTANAESIIASWDAAQNATSYTVEYKKTADANWTVAGTTQNLTYTIDNLSSETSYDVRVKGVNGDSESSYSTTVSTSTLKKAAFPKNIANADELIALLTGSEVSTASATDVVNITADIDMTGKTLTSTAVFAGVLNGNNHSIKNWKGTTPLFATLGSAQDLTIDATCSLEPTSFPFGALAATSTGKISNVTNNATVTASISGDATDAIVLGGLIGISDGDMEKCSNNGAVTLSASGSFMSSLIGGVVGYEGGKLDNCNNTGAINVSGTTLSKCVAIKDISLNVPVLTGGVAAIARNTASSCNNSGKITYALSAIDKIGVTKSLGRVNIGGVIAAPNGDLTSCKNTGDLDISTISSTGAVFSSANYILCIGGVTGGDAYADGQSKTNVISCSNEGAVSVKADQSSSNMAIGGVVGWPGLEAATLTDTTITCTNKGNVTVSGFGKARVGGIHGGAGNLRGCKNYGTVTSDLGTKASAFGGISGYMGVTLKMKNCENYGDVINKSTATIDVGGLIGNFGGNECTTGEGCIVKCTVSTVNDATYAGMVIGYYNSPTKLNTLGTTASPIKVSGNYSVSGTTTALTSTNYATYLKGTYANSASQVVNAVFGE